MSLIMQLKGHVVATAENGLAAVELARENAFDVCFLDIQMPDLSGVETLRRIRDLRPEAEVVMMTAYSADGVIEEALAEGASGIVNKPLDMEQVFATIAAAGSAKKRHSAGLA